jgi:hypothetical protein
VAVAREHLARFPSSPDAAERDWFLVRGLASLGKNDEATAEARRMVAMHPGTSWAADVERHMLVNPP